MKPHSSSSCADLTIVDALNLGDKLQSILYYHFLPQAYNASQLAALGSSDTDLGVSTGTPYNLTFGQSPTGQVPPQFLVCGPGLEELINQETECFLASLSSR